MSTSMRSAEKGTAAGSSSKRPCAGKDGDDEEATKHFRLDSDASSLHCPICLTQYEGQIYMCANGHAACARCCLGMNRKCGCCNEPIGDVRCRALENLLADLTAPCAFRDFGCGELLRYTELRAHEETCTTTSSPSTTPPASSSSPPRTWGPRRCRSHARRVVFVLLNGGEVLGGRCLSLVRLGPSSRNEGDDAAEVRYKMEAALLNHQARTVVVNSVLDTLPTYAMCAIQLLQGTIDSFDSLRRAFMWAGDKSVTGVQCLVNWDAVTRPKDHGGLGIRDLGIQNSCLLLKLIHVSSTHCGRLVLGALSAKPHRHLLAHRRPRRCTLERPAPPAPRLPSHHNS
ncbi:hypothetical protein PR202_gb26662 [Eleusine coracana subsp. coracana]|uniref:RING-type E3 ubiquitin transferase n=1 Tax=Eleusine coracana subsp. coracana TaxID=191504 RepID=A0AAV5FTU7_ELECO|nr:hypothetical protein PR202_gb26662 [Eleusine coracana subsp. coracana]